MVAVVEQVGKCALHVVAFVLGTQGMALQMLAARKPKAASHLASTVPKFPFKVEVASHVVSQFLRPIFNTLQLPYVLFFLAALLY